MSVAGFVRVVVLIAVSLATSGDVIAQRTRFAAGVEAVRVDALVTEGNRPVLNLTKDDFELRDNGVLQQLTSVEVERVPVSLALAVDNSSSVAGARLERLIGASEELLRYVRPDDRVGVVGFSHIMRRQSIQPGTTSLNARRMTAVGSTGLYDAIHTALLQAKSGNARALALVFTDGRDNSSWLTEDDLLAAAKRSATVLYVVGLPPSSGVDTSNTAMQTLAEATGGRFLVAGNDDDIALTFRQVLDEFRQRYLLVYTPADVAQGGAHKIDVTVRREGVNVRARSGYEVR
jgi:Ca-activated chloride channel homolog